MTDDASLDATAQAELVRSGEATPLELVEAAIERIERIDDTLNAVIHRRFDEARTEAASAALPDGPFRGVPFLLKDLGAGGQLDGTPFHRGNAALKAAGWTHQSGDSYVVRRLRDAGFVVVGKTNTPEFGFACTTEPHAYGATHNPWDVTRTPAGSSGGSAAAVASGMVPAAHATDGGGSIRMPASACGLVGLKVTRGRISAGPHSGDSSGGRGVEGCVTRTVRDTAAILDVLAGPEPGDPAPALLPARPYSTEVGTDPGRLRVGLRTTALDDRPVHQDCVAAAEAAAAALASLGHHVEESWPAALGEQAIGFDAIFPVHAATTAATVDVASRQLGRELGEADCEHRTWEQVQLGRTISGPRLVEAQETIVGWTRRMVTWWQDFDVLLTPTLGTPPPELGTLAWADDPEAVVRVLEFNPFCAVWNWTGLPAITVPTATNAAGLPIGVMLVATYGREDVLLRVAAQLEQALPWSDRRPAVYA